MKLSIITVANSRIATIGQAIDNVSTQSYSDVEHLVIDSASTHSTLEVLKTRQNSGMQVLSILVALLDLLPVYEVICAAQNSGAIGR